jgi:transcription initiation factor TFIIB
MDENMCPECGGKIERDESGERVCSNCGLVAIGRPNTSLDKEDEQTENDLEQVLKQDTEKLGSVIDGAGPEDWEGVEHQGKYRKLKWLQEKENRYKPLDDKVDRIKAICAQYNLPEIIYKTASDLTKKALEKGITNGYTEENTIGAVIFAAHKINRIPCTLHDACIYMGIDPRYINQQKETTIHRLYMHLKKEIGFSAELLPAREYVPKYCTGLKLSQEAQKKAIEIADKIEYIENNKECMKYIKITSCVNVEETPNFLNISN